MSFVEVLEVCGWLGVSWFENTILSGLDSETRRRCGDGLRRSRIVRGVRGLLLAHLVEACEVLPC